MQQPSLQCGLCARLCDFRASNQAHNPLWHNAPVPSFGNITAQILIVGLAPGLRGANRTGRPFTGDGAGDVLYSVLQQCHMAHGDYNRNGNDTLVLNNVRISNAVRCVPPQNKPTPAEIATCLPFLQAEIASMQNLRAIVALGGVAHASICKALGVKLSAHRFGHGAMHTIGNILLANSYHCSRYNVSTKRVNATMVAQVLQQTRDYAAQGFITLSI